MTLILPTDRPTFWAVEYNGAVALTGQTQVGEATAAAYVVYSDVDENAYLGQVVGKATAYNPLPDSGWLTAGDIYGYGGGLVIVRQSHNRTEHAPADVPALFSVYRPAASGPLPWVANEPVFVGTQREFGGKTYRCVIGHVTQTDWTPDVTPALWAEVVATPPGPQPWVQPVGSTDAYALGARVTHNGQVWESTIAANVWMPSVYGWVVVG